MSGRHEHEAQLFGELFVLSQRLTRHADAALRAYGMTSKQWLLLAVLVKAFPGASPSLTEAARVYGASRQNVRAIAEHLAGRGLVELRPDPADRRSTRIAVTDRVAALFDTPDAAASQQAFVAAAFRDLPDDDVAQLRRLVATLLATLDTPEDT